MKTLLKYVHLAYLSKPPGERGIYRWVRRLRPRKIVELGIGDGLRTTRILGLTLQLNDQLHYCGIDLFEAREAQSPGLTYKRAFRLLRLPGAHVTLVPGDPYTALARTANALTGTDMLLISADQSAASLEQAWFYLPRMLHDGSVVLRQDPQGLYQPLDRDAIQRLADTQQALRRAA